MVFCKGEGSVMNDGFGGLPEHCDLFLFSGWVLDTPAKYTVAVLCTAFMAMGSEVLRVWRARWDRVFDHSLPKDIALSLVYGIHMLNAYFLMLLIMLYDTYFLMAIVFGLTIGHFVARRMQHDDRRIGYEVLPDAKAVNTTGSTKESAIDFEGVSGNSPCCR
eukprot:TRINITY_DN4602_c0_g1_i1.p1 TRINITY_DN4602_c0_g1~~TRINITY_DN4602_c0_g1_i1.p1  ORF type:complete len:162 (+),score=6.80 TRINITY_DN4602_c0_g1_i1:143-628(+)